MIGRILASLAAVSVAVSLVLVGCEPPAGDGTKTPPPKAGDSAPKEPAPSTPPAPKAPEGEKKTSAAPGAQASGIIAAAGAATQQAMTCAKSGCNAAGDASKSLVHSGKPVIFCCDSCLGAFKKANNIQ